MKYFFTVMYFFFSLLNSADIEESKTSGIKLFIEGSGLDLTIIPCILKHKFFGNNKFNFKEIPEDELPNKIKIKLTESFLHFIQVYLNMQEFRLLFSTKDNLPTEEKIKFIEDYSKKLNFFAIKGLFTTYILISIKNSPYCYFSWSNGEECGSIFDGPKKESGIALYQLLTQNNISNIDTVWGFSNGGVVLGYLLEAIKKNKSKLKVEYAYLLETPLFRKVEENLNLQNETNNPICEEIFIVNAKPEFKNDKIPLLDIFEGEGGRPFRRPLQLPKNWHNITVTEFRGEEYNQKFMHHGLFGHSEFIHPLAKKSTEIQKKNNNKNYDISVNFNYTHPEVITRIAVSENQNHIPDPDQKKAYASRSFIFRASLASLITIGSPIMIKILLSQRKKISDAGKSFFYKIFKK